ncbi:MAG: MBOAT family protein [Oscillospiraceae bacterium]|nr:MBOAT family protein [Oscillospiraceae bacterium]
MIFSSFEFLFFFLPLVLLLYYLVFRRSPVLQNFVLLIASLLFYAWGEPLFVFAMIACIIVNWGFGYLCLIARRDDSKYTGIAKKLLKPALLFTVAADISLLTVFKYAAFFTHNINQLLSFELSVPQIALPIGISFFVFQAVSYTVDVYRGTVAPQKRLSLVALYISLFPQLMAGPIIRYSTIEKQLTSRTFKWDDFSSGFRRFIIGLGKKVIIADVIAQAADMAFGADPLTMSVTAAWLGAAAFGLQIFFDFSGYSDMAIGLGKMFGFHFLENFNFPYISRSISEFWRRWHISLGAWFRDYVYFPMGGSKVKSKWRLVFNLFVVWALTGLWHGAAWTFVVWGLFFFVLIAFEKVTGFDKRIERVPVLSSVYMLACVLVGWVLFRAESGSHAFIYLLSMVGLNENPVAGFDTLRLSLEFVFTWGIGVIACIPITKVIMAQRFAQGTPAKIFRWAYAVFVLMLSIVLMYGSGTSPFIYFAF